MNISKFLRIPILKNFCEQLLLRILESTEIKGNFVTKWFSTCAKQAIRILEYVGNLKILRNSLACRKLVRTLKKIIESFFLVNCSCFFYV